MSPYENFIRDAIDNPAASWNPCGVSTARSIWEELIGWRLSPSRAHTFRNQDHARKLARLREDDVREAGRDSLARNPDGHLLLSEWHEAAMDLARARLQQELDRAREQRRLADEDERRRRSAQREQESAQVAAQQRAARLREGPTEEITHLPQC